MVKTENDNLRNKTGRLLDSPVLVNAVLYTWLFGVIFGYLYQFRDIYQSVLKLLGLL